MRIILIFTIFIIFTHSFSIAFNSHPTQLSPTQHRLQNHVAFLSSDKLAGRLTGTSGEKLTTHYIAAEFAKIGLEPAGDKGSFFQEFPLTNGVHLGKNNVLIIKNQNNITKKLMVNQDWIPLAFSNNENFKTNRLVFAGYGMTAPAMGKLKSYDSYQNLQVNNQWVIVFNNLPTKISEQQYSQLSPYASCRYKALIAKSLGAKGIIFVNAPHTKNTQELIPFSDTYSSTNAGMLVLSIKYQIIYDLFLHDRKFKPLLDSLEKGKLPTLPAFQQILMTGQIQIQKNRQYGRNVLAKLKMSDNNNKSLILIGAHADHLGHGEVSGSRAEQHETGMIHPGADDNASGTACVLEAARKLSQLKKQGKLQGNKDVLFAAWSGEELGILGSSHFVRHNHTSIAAAINLDMVGHIRKNLILQGIGSSLDWTGIIKQIKNNKINILTQDDPYLPTDSTSFYLHNIPILNFFSGAFNEYHTPRDKANLLNYAGMEQATDILVSLIFVLQKKPDFMNYNTIPKKNDMMNDGLKVYLGTIPDYASTIVSGVKIAGVAKKSPADHAGLKTNDIIIKLSDKKINDIYDYTFTLNSLRIERATSMVVLRNHKTLLLTVIPQARGVTNDG